MSARNKRVTEQEINRKLEIETKMAEDKERDDQRLAKLAESQQQAVKKPLNGLVKKITTQGAVVRPVASRMGRRFR